jgi:transcriptional antiterminator RfaH
MIADSSTLDETTPWFCLRARPRRERRAAFFLRQRVGIEVFSPTISFREAGASGLVRRVSEALFPGYVFARFAYPTQLRHVLSTEHVLGLVHVASEPARVDPRFVSFLQSNVNSTDAIAPDLSVGAWARVVAGCFRDAHGRILQVDAPHDRVRLLLVLLGREIQISVPAAHLLPLAAGMASHCPSVLRAEHARPAPAA